MTKTVAVTNLDKCSVCRAPAGLLCRGRYGQAITKPHDGRKRKEKGYSKTT